jgi:lipoate---protein ligase
MTSSDTYRLVRSSDSAAAFHARVVADPARSELWWHEFDAPALVLGSSQDASVVDTDACERAGIAIVRRRSGGGAVLLVPGEVTWLDVIVPTGGIGWSSDVHQPMMWLGRHLGAVVGSLVGSSRRVDVHQGPMVSTAWSSQVCFDGLGIGEVLLDGRKLVGISQRRTRQAARLQCCWYSSHDHDALRGLLLAPHRPAHGDLAEVATLPRELAEALPGALLDRLR